MVNPSVNTENALMYNLTYSLPKVSSLNIIPPSSTALMHFSNSNKFQSLPLHTASGCEQLMFLCNADHSLINRTLTTIPSRPKQKRKKNLGSKSDKELTFCLTQCNMFFLT